MRMEQGDEGRVVSFAIDRPLPYLLPSLHDAFSGEVRICATNLNLKPNAQLVRPAPRMARRRFCFVRVVPGGRRRAMMREAEVDS